MKVAGELFDDLVNFSAKGKKEITQTLNDTITVLVGMRLKGLVSEGVVSSFSVRASNNACI